MRSILLIGLGIVAAAVIAAAASYVLTSESTKTRQAQRIAVLESNERLYLNSINEQKQTIGFLEESIERQRFEFERVQSEFRTIREENTNFKEQLEALELSKKAVENPSAVEIILNETTLNMNRCFELSTGATLTDDERNATNAEEFNSTCPWLFDELRTR